MLSCRTGGDWSTLASGEDWPAALEDGQTVPSRKACCVSTEMSPRCVYCSPPAAAGNWLGGYRHQRCTLVIKRDRAGLDTRRGLVPDTVRGSYVRIPGYLRRCWEMADRAVGPTGHGVPRGGPVLRCHSPLSAGHTACLTEKALVLLFFKG